MIGIKSVTAVAVTGLIGMCAALPAATSAATASPAPTYVCFEPQLQGPPTIVIGATAAECSQWAQVTAVLDGYGNQGSWGDAATLACVIEDVLAERLVCNPQ